METTKLKNVLQEACPSCGSRLAYSAEKQKIACNHCGHTEEVNQNRDKVQERSLGAVIEESKTFVPENTGKKVIHCDNCGSNYMVEAQQIAAQCTFCASHKVNLEAFDHRIIQPAGIIPLKIGKEQGYEFFRKWIKKGFWHPRKLKKLASIENLHGIYIPFWTYDAQTESSWTGEAGYHYYVTQTYKDSDGNTQTRQVRKTRWKRRSGHLSHFFDDVLVVASRGIPQEHVEKIFPYNLDEVVNFDAKLMLGWEAEIYSIEVDEGYNIADGIMEQDIRRMCSSQLGGDTQRNLRINTNKSGHTFKHIILPIWICSYLFKKKSYQFLINGQTGRVGGDKPIAVWKVVLAVLFALAIAGVVWYFSENQGM